ncbi:MAG: radical SAM protein [Armatimonadota bacterium]|jgi:MoaA/NifB/PqqE/SkfB family radical SAM enzyme
MAGIRRRILNTVVEMGSDEDAFVSHLRRLARFGKRVAPSWQHRRQLAMLEEAVEADHPAVELIRRVIRDCHPNYRVAVADLFITHSWEGSRQRRRFEAQHRTPAPSFIVISPLASCNLSCTGCYAGAYGDAEPVLPGETIERLIEEVRGWGSRFVTISGGEPTLLWERIPGEDRGLREILAQYRDMMFLMYTNGTLIGDEMAAEMAALGNVSPAISLEGHREQTDARRGEGVYERIIEAMATLRRHRVLFGASVTYTSRNWETVASDEFIDTLIALGCMHAWYFMYVPVGRDPDLSLMVTPRQREIVARKTWQWLTGRPLFVADFWNSGPLTKGCMAAGAPAGYLHVTHRGDICPCVFMMYSRDNVHEMDSKTPLLDALRSDFFEAIREGQRATQDNPLAPCQIVDHPETLRRAVDRCDAHSTQTGQRILEELAPEVAGRAREWRALARERWTRSGTFANFADAYAEDGWLPPG